MAKLYSDETGKLIRFLRNEQEEQQYPDPPVGTAETLSFDADTNPAVVRMLDTSWRDCRLSGGQFFWQDVVQTIQAPSRRFLDRSALQIIVEKLQSDTSPTAAELRILLRFLLRAVRQLR